MENIPQDSNIEVRLQALERRGVNSPSFFTRAFSVWGYYLVAQLLISIVVFVVILVLGIITGFSGITQ